MVKKRENPSKLINLTRIQVRFSEVDSMRIVWHGEYIRYFEDGREAFGRQYEGLGYMDIYDNGYLAPMVDLQVQFKKPLRCNDQAVVETRFIEHPAAKICFEYKITRLSDGETVATGNSIQVFTNMEGELELLSPGFYKEWKKRWIEK